MIIFKEYAKIVKERHITKRYFGGRRGRAVICLIWSMALKNRLKQWRITDYVGSIDEFRW